MNVIHYDHQFNANEWCIILSLMVGIGLVIFLPKRFNKQTTFLYLICGVFSGFFFDHVLSVIPVSFYDINDSSSFEFMDFLSHMMYSTYSYFFFYLYEMFRIKPNISLLYILAWAFLSVAIELLLTNLGVFHYRHGYNIYYSFVIYLLVLSSWVIFHRMITVHGDQRF
jgi:hypothetical protein